ncbi:MAG: hypothetical protein J3Q66DRAFT_206297 [Benniella sp.]|nr:MAG: hypothetical protein J3Q66DRAFT_206297 [Benniella sp.]
MEDTAVNLAHRYANAAEDFEERGQWQEAMNMHIKAADQFLLATRDTQSQDVIQTLRLMSANHSRKGKDLQRKVAKAEAAAAVAIPQQKSKGEGGQSSLSKATAAAMAEAMGGGGSGSGNGAVTGGSASSSSSSRRRAGSGHYPPNQYQQGGAGGQHLHAPHNQYPNNPSYQGMVGGELGRDLRGGDSGSEDSDLSSSSSEIPGNSSSSTMIEESFTVIKNRAKDKSDPFYKFWEAVEQLVVKISSPVAFTSIPLEGDNPMLSNSPSMDDPLTTDAPFAVQGGNASLASSGVKASQTTTTSSSTGPSSQSRSSKSRSGHDPSSMHESFFIIDSPSSSSSQLKSSHPRSRSESNSKMMASSSRRANDSTAAASRNSSKTLEEYAIENQQLKMTLDKLSRRNMKLEKNLEGQMQMSVWAKDVQRSAMQLVGQDVLRSNIVHSIMDLSAASLNLPRPQAIAGSTHQTPVSSASSQIITGTPINTNDPATMQARLKELEEEVIKLRLENAKLGSSMKKYKQRWEDLKESAKKRRNASSTPPMDGQNTATAVSAATSINPYSTASLAGNPYSNVSTHGNDSGQVSAGRPVGNLGRSSSASGPVLHAGSSYQKRILSDNRFATDTTSLSMQHRHSAGGIVSSTSPRVLDASSRTHMGSLPTVAEIPRSSSVPSVASSSDMTGSMSTSMYASGIMPGNES